MIYSTYLLENFIAGHGVVGLEGRPESAALWDILGFFFFFCERSHVVLYERLILFIIHNYY